MNAFIAIIFASLLSRLGYQMARTPVLPALAADLGAWNGVHFAVKHPGVCTLWNINDSAKASQIEMEPDRQGTTTVGF
jgi:hypothetical protein